MPNLIVPFVSIESTIYNDIYYKIISDVAKIIKLDEDTIKIYHNSMEIGKTDNKDTAKRQSDNNTPFTTSRKRLLVNVKDEFDEDSVATEVINRRDSFPVFRDPQIGVSIAPIYLVNNMEFQFKYVSPSKIDVNQIRDNIRMLLAKHMSIFTHDLEYTMVMPEFIEDFICDVHELKDRLYPISLSDYLNGYSTNRLHSITDMSNKENTLLAIREKQLRVLGEFEFTAVPPERDTDNNKNQYSLNFTYRVQMEIPKAISVAFPIMICNRLMKDKYINIIEEQANKELDRKINKHLSLGRSSTVLNNIGYNLVQDRISDVIYPINIPNYDQYLDSAKVPGYGTIITVLCEVDEEDKKSLFNLKELGEWEIGQHVLNYIKDNLKETTKLFESYIYLGLEQHGKYMGRDILEIDEDFNIRSSIPLDLIRPVRVSIMVCVDLTMLTENALNKLIADDDMFECYLLEYLELKDILTDNRTKFIAARDNKLYRILINKIAQLADNSDYDRIKRYVKIIETDPVTSRDMGSFMVRGYPELFRNLLMKRVCWVSSLGNLYSFSKDEETREKEYNESYYHVLRTRKLNGTSSNAINRTRYEQQFGIRQFLQKTVSNNYVVNRRKESSDGNSK